MFLPRIVRSLIVSSARCWESIRDFLREEHHPSAIPGWDGKIVPIDPANAQAHALPPTAPHDVGVTIVRNMQSAIVRPGQSFPLFDMYVDVDPRLANERTKWKLVRRKLRAKIALERGPTKFDELAIALDIMFTPPRKRAGRLNGIRIQLYECIERYGLWYGRWFFLGDIAKEIGAVRRIASAGRVLKRILRFLGPL
jgi:hypothetical protein